MLSEKKLLELYKIIYTVLRRLGKSDKANLFEV